MRSQPASGRHPYEESARGERIAVLAPCREASEHAWQEIINEEPGVRKQYHFWPSPEGLMAWDVHRLIELSQDFPRITVPVDSIREIDQVYWFDDSMQRPTCRKVLEHISLINEVDLSYPIILSANGRVMDGMHRVARAFLDGIAEIEAVQFETDPEPDYVGCRPEDLPY